MAFAIAAQRALHQEIGLAQAPLTEPGGIIIFSNGMAVRKIFAPKASLATVGGTVEFKNSITFSPSQR